MDDQERQRVADEMVRDLFGIDIPADALPGEPASAAELRSKLMTQAFTDSWTRTALDRKTRSLLTVAIVATLGLDRELRAHVGGALKLGVTPEELVDLFIHLGAYAGAPRASAGWTIASDVLVKASARAQARPG
jgi:alkylhydroperoxidase/carboxymuconolactone decarboxylase family protein YurZ